MNIKNMWNFGIAVITASAAVVQGRPIIGTDVNSNVPEFAGNYTAEFMIDYLMKHRGSKVVDPEIVRQDLWNATGYLDSAKLLKNWNEFAPPVIYHAIKNSTNGLKFRSTEFHGNPPVETPNDGLAAMVTASFIQLVEVAGDYTYLTNGELPNWEMRGIWSKATPLFGAADPPEYIKKTFNETKLYGTFLAWGPLDNPISYADVFNHELNHCLTLASSDDLNMSIAAYEGYTEALATTFSQNTTDNREREITYKGQYQFVAVVSVLDDPCRNTGNLSDLNIVDSDFRPMDNATGYVAPIAPSQFSKGLDFARRAYYRGEKDDVKLVSHLYNQVRDYQFNGSKAPNCTLNEPGQHDQNNEFPLWAKITASVTGTALLVAGAVAAYYGSRRCRSGQGNEQTNGDQQINVVVDNDNTNISDEILALEVTTSDRFSSTVFETLNKNNNNDEWKIDEIELDQIITIPSNNMDNTNESNVVKAEQSTKKSIQESIVSINDHETAVSVIELPKQNEVKNKIAISETMKNTQQPSLEGEVRIISMERIEGNGRYKITAELENGEKTIVSAKSVTGIKVGELAMLKDRHLEPKSNQMNVRKNLNKQKQVLK